MPGGVRIAHVKCEMNAVKLYEQSQASKHSRVLDVSNKERLLCKESMRIAKSPHILEVENCKYLHFCLKTLQNQTILQ